LREPVTAAAGINLPEAEISAICRRHQVGELYLFGSAARGDLRPDSDIDLLVDFLPAARPGLLGVLAMRRELAAVLGRPVDLAIKPALKPRVRPQVLAEARLIYAA
jgi:predicted nucleotidyltransferase